MFDYMVCIGFYVKDYDKVNEAMERLQSRYPEQRWKIYAFPEHKMFLRGESYDFILVVFTDSYDKAHKIGLALVKKYLPEVGVSDCYYWVKEGF